MVPQFIYMPFLNRQPLIFNRLVCVIPVSSSSTWAPLELAKPFYGGGISGPIQELLRSTGYGFFWFGE